MIKEEKNKKVFVICMSILLVLVLVIGGSYAWFTLQLKGTKANVLRAGTLSLRLDDENSVGINSEKAVPMLDEVGEQLDPYHFTLINEGDQYVEYTIYFDDNELEENETRMADNKVKYNLVKDTRSKIALLSTLGENPNRVLDHGTIKGGQTIAYDLRLWIDSEASNEVMGQVVRGKLRVVATQVTETVVNEQNLSMSVIGGNGISFSEGVNTPLTDEEGAKLEPYYFSLKNTSGEESEYTVTLEDASTYRMRSVSAPLDKIKYQLKKNNEVIATDVLSETIIGEEKVLDTGVIEAGSTNNYELRLWLDSSVSEEDANSYSFRAQLKTKAQEVIDGTNPECFKVSTIDQTIRIDDYLCVAGNTKGLPTITDVVIPRKINGMKVTAINDAFKSKNLTSVIIPNTVITIPYASFMNNQLTSLIIPNSVTTIGENAFRENQLVNLNIQNGVEVIGKAAFYNNKLTSIMIPSSVTTIEEHAFNSNQLEEVIISEGVLTIGVNAFHGNKLTSITIPSTVTTIDFYAFHKSASSNPSLTTIVNKTGRSFNWKNITEGKTSATFATGTITHPYGNIIVSAS